MREKIAKELLAKVKADYNEISVAFCQTRQSEWREFASIENFFKKNPDGNLGKVLDLGCGNGRLYSFLKNHFKNFHYVGIDFSTALLAEAKRAHKKKGATKTCATFVEGDILSLPFPDNTFDTIFSIASLHHIPSQNFREKAVKEIERVLKPNGHLVLLVWNLWQKRYAKHIIRSMIGFLTTLGKYDLFDLFIPWQHTIFRYYHAFTKRELHSLLAKNDFTTEKIEKGRNFSFFCKKCDKNPRNILGITFDAKSEEEILEEIPRYLSSEQQHVIVTPNPEILLHAQKNPEFHNIIEKADLRIPDGSGILWATTVKNRFIALKNLRFKHGFRFFYHIVLVAYSIFSLATLIVWKNFCRKIIQNTVTGTDLMQKICSLQNRDLKVFFLGAKKGIAEKTAHILNEKNPNLTIADSDAGKSTPDDEKRITSLIRRSGANVLFVAFGAPVQELWLARNLQEIPNIRLAMGIGGAFDYISGKQKRAPLFIRKIGLEWLCRVIAEPSRWKRIGNAVIQFPIAVIRELW